MVLDGLVEESSSSTNGLFVPATKFIGLCSGLFLQLLSSSDFIDGGDPMSVSNPLFRSVILCQKMSNYCTAK